MNNALPTLGITSLATNPGETGIVFAGTGGYGIYRCGVVGIHKQVREKSLSLLRISPDPATDKVNIYLNVSVFSDVMLKICNSSGRLVRQFDHTTIRRSNQIIWDRKDANGVVVPAGVYFCFLKTSGVASTKKLIVVD